MSTVTLVSSRAEVTLEFSDSTMTVQPATSTVTIERAGGAVLFADVVAALNAAESPSEDNPFLTANETVNPAFAISNTHSPSGATAYQLPVYDSAGVLLGYIPIYGSAW